jgi:vacuolar protein sorting-associated protein 35
VSSVSPVPFSFANITRNIYPERLDYIDQVLTFANQKVGEYQNSADLHSQATQSQILSLLLAPIKTYVSLFTALALPNYIPLLHSQPYPTRRAVAGEVARSLMRNQTYITSVENLESSLEILKVLIREGIQQATGYPGGPIQRRAQETEETIEEQGWLARIVHLIRGKDNDTQFKVSSHLGIRPA